MGDLQEPVVRTLNINLYAAPGVGKSSIAAQLVALLKRHRVDVELVSEYAKDLHWAGVLHKTEQFEICAEQWRRQNLLQGKVDVVVTDSAIPLGLLYTPAQYRKPLSEVIKTLTENWIELNVMLERDLSTGFSTIGRQHTAEQSMVKQSELRDLMDEFNIPHLRETVNSGTAQRLAAKISELLVDPSLSRSLEDAQELDFPREKQRDGEKVASSRSFSY